MDGGTPTGKVSWGKSRLCVRVGLHEALALDFGSWLRWLAPGCRLRIYVQRWVGGAWIWESFDDAFTVTLCLGHDGEGVPATVAGC
jgi:hypothetical protein